MRRAPPLVSRLSAFTLTRPGTPRRSSPARHLSAARHLALGSALAALVAVPALAEDTLTILHTNDVHARFEPITKTDSTCAPEDNAADECFGGSARLVTAIAAARAEAPASLLLDAGDQFQGTLFYTQYLGKAAAEVMTTLGYEAMAVGNHEFDNGPEGLVTLLDGVSFPLLMANADISREPLLKDRVVKSTVIEKAGHRIGIIGLTPLDNPELASPGPRINFTPPADAVQAEVDALTEAGVRRIILLSHSGYALDQRLAGEVTGIDVIVGGHSHTLLSSTDPAAAGPYPTMVGTVPIVQAYAYGKYLGRLDVTFNDAGEVVSAAGAPILLDASVPEDPAMVARITELAQPLEAIRAEVVAETAEAIDGSRETCRAGECAMGNLVADAMLDRVKGQGVSIAITNGGGLRASIDAGPVTKGEVLTVLPFQNTLSTFTASGAEIIAALENGVSQLEDGGGRFPQVAGVRYTFDPAAPVGARVSAVEVAGDAAGGGGWTSIDPAAVYSAVSNNYMRNGGDGYSMFVNAEKAYDFGPDLADVTADYLAKNLPYQPYLDGRITRK